jgi:hypothetical protein
MVATGRHPGLIFSFSALQGTPGKTGNPVNFFLEGPRGETCGVVLLKQAQKDGISWEKIYCFRFLRQ